MTLINSDRSPPRQAAGVRQSLAEGAENRDPVDLFGEWFQEATDAGLHLPEAMALSTCTADGRPSCRMVLLKQFDARGFVFYTNFSSRKSQEIRGNPHVALLLHWAALERQVRIEGCVTPVETREAAAYFRTRPRGSQAGAWASRQSAPLDNRAALVTAVERIEARFSNQDIPLPEFWGGWRVRPERIEFWQGQPNRLHDRLIFTRQDNAWHTHRLYP